MAPNELYRLMRLVEREIDQKEKSTEGPLHTMHDHLLHEFLFMRQTDDERWFPTQKEDRA